MTEVPQLQHDAVPSRPVSTPDLLADVNHPLVQETAARLTDPAEKLERIFGFVRDDILFGFPPEGDFVRASQTIERHYGQCNTKGILILALCQAARIPARLHFSGIAKKIQHGFFRGLFYKLMPNEISHSWLEVELDDAGYRSTPTSTTLPFIAPPRWVLSSATTARGPIPPITSTARTT